MNTAKVLGLDVPWQLRQLADAVTKTAESPLKRLRGVEPALPEQRSMFLLDLDAQGPDQSAVFRVFAFDLGGECLGR
jgi:hypothetical protein